MKRKMEDKPVDVLIEDLKTQAVFVKKTAIMQLEKKKAVKAVPTLVELAHDPEASIRGCVAWALGQLGDLTVQPALMSLLNDMDSTVRRAAAQSLSKVGDSLATSPLQKLSIDADRFVREAAVDAMLKIGRRETPSSVVAPLSLKPTPVGAVAKH